MASSPLNHPKLPPCGQGAFVCSDDPQASFSGGPSCWWHGPLSPLFQSPSVSPLSFSLRVCNSPLINGFFCLFFLFFSLTCCWSITIFDFGTFRLFFSPPSPLFPLGSWLLKLLSFGTVFQPHWCIVVWILSPFFLSLPVQGQVKFPF